MLGPLLGGAHHVIQERSTQIDTGPGRFTGGPKKGEEKQGNSRTRHKLNHEQHVDGLAEVRD